MAIKVLVTRLCRVSLTDLYRCEGCTYTYVLYVIELYVIELSTLLRVLKCLSFGQAMTDFHFVL
jgi:hypothetical protein